MLSHSQCELKAVKISRIVQKINQFLEMANMRKIYPNSMIFFNKACQHLSVRECFVDCMVVNSFVIKASKV